MRLLNKRMGNNELPTYYPDTVEAANHLSKSLIARGGFPQQDRMIKDKRKVGILIAGAIGAVSALIGAMFAGAVWQTEVYAKDTYKDEIGIDLTLITTLTISFIYFPFSSLYGLATDTIIYSFSISAMVGIVPSIFAGYSFCNSYSDIPNGWLLDSNRSLWSAEHRTMLCSGQ